MQDENTQIPSTTEETKQIMPAENPQAISENSKLPFFTFNFNTLLGLIAIVGIVILYILHFSTTRETPAVPSIAVQKPSGKSLSIVFVNTDSLNAHYDYVKILRRDLEATGKKLQAEVLAESSALEKEGAEFQRQMSSSQISEDKAKVVYEQLMQRQQVLMEKKDRYTQQIAEQELAMNIRLVDSVTAFLRRFNRDFHFDYIMGYKTAGEILVANDTLDITRPVIDALNNEFKLRKK